MDTAQWPQEIVVKPMNEIVVVPNTSGIATSSAKTCSKPTSSSSSDQSCRKVRPQNKEQQVLNCPRCNSSNTKFCYYNNYSLSQPRYFCKTCRRYWTEGGTLRNIPVGGGSRKNSKRSSSSSSSNSSSSTSFVNSHSSSANNSSKKLLPPPPPPPDSSDHQNPIKNLHNFDHNQDLNLGFSDHQSTTANDFKTISQLIQVPNFDNLGNNNNNKIMQIIPNSSSTSSTTTNSHLSAMELLTGIQSSRGLMNSFMPMLPSMSDHHNPNTTFFSSVPSSMGFPLTTDHHQFMKPVSGLNFSLDNELGLSSAGNGRILFPFEDLKLQATSDNATTDPPPTDDHSDQQQQIDVRDEHGGDHSTGFWNGMLGTGGSW